MNDIVEFLRARLAEDSEHTQWLAEDWWLDVDYSETSEAVRRFADSDRVLREIEVQRAEIDELADLLADEPCEAHDPIESGLHEDYDRLLKALAERFLRRKAAAYSDHPDYRKEWAREQ